MASTYIVNAIPALWFCKARIAEQKLLVAIIVIAIMKSLSRSLADIAFTDDLGFVTKINDHSIVEGIE